MGKYRQEMDLSRFSCSCTGNRAIVRFMRVFSFELDKERVAALAEIRDGRFFPRSKSAGRRLAMLLENGLHRLTSAAGRRAVYIQPGIPLLGSPYFGLIDRDTSLVEIRPITGCNLDCIFCSVAEGGVKQADYVVEPGWLVQCFKELAAFKQTALEAHINPQGEPLLYEPIVELVQGLSRLARVSMDTNGTLLNKSLIDRLAAAGLSGLNVSLNALDKKLAGKLAGCPYDVSHVLDMLSYAKTRTGVLVAPVWLPGLNDKEIEKIIALCTKEGYRIGIQNYVPHRHGRKPVRALSMDAFARKLAEWEERYKIDLKLDAGDFNICSTRPLPRPFRKGERVKAELVCPGRHAGEMLASARGRLIVVKQCDRMSGSVVAEILRTKHNIFFGKKK